MGRQGNPARTRARRRMGATAAAIALAALATGAQTAAADDRATARAWAIDQYAQQYGVSQERAETVLQEQSRGVQLREALQTSLGGDLLGLRFDAERSRWIVAVSGAGDGDAAEQVLDARGLGTSVVERKDWTAADRRTSVSDLNQQLRSLTRAGVVTISDRGDELRVTSVGATPAQRSAIAAAVEQQDVDVAVERLPDDGVTVGPQACNNIWCDAPVRAGERWVNQVSNNFCTLAFTVTSPVSSYNYALTAGHCITGAGVPASAGKCSLSFCDGAFGNQHGGYWSSGGDGGLIQIPNTGLWPTQASWWNHPTYEALPVTGQFYPWVGAYVCHTGQASYNAAANTRTSCGNVSGLNVTAPYDPRRHPQPTGMIAVDGACNEPGNSGGPWIDPYSGWAMGIHSGGSINPNGGPQCGAGSTSYVEPIGRALSNQGVVLRTM